MSGSRTPQKVIEAQLKSVPVEEYTNKVHARVKNNVLKLFHESDLSQRQFAYQAGISHSSLNRITENKSFSLETICKIGAGLNLPIENLICGMSIEECNHLKVYSKLTDEEKAKIDREINKMINTDKSKQKKYEYTGQLTLFDFLDKPS